MKFLLKRALIVLFCVSAAVAIGFSSLGLLLSVYADKPEQADVIVVLGGDKGLRVRKGAELYNAGYAPRVLLTGIDQRYYRPWRPNWRERRMINMGVPKRAILVDTASKTSWEEAVNTAKIMDKRGWKRAIVVSDPPHLLRLQLTWSKVFRGSSKEFLLIPTTPEWWNQFLWWKDPKSYQFVMSELKKNLFYIFGHYGWFPFLTI